MTWPIPNFVELFDYNLVPFMPRARFTFTYVLIPLKYVDLNLIRGISIKIVIFHYSKGHSI
jgi:hypothetical protein